MATFGALSNIDLEHPACDHHAQREPISDRMSLPAIQELAVPSFITATEGPQPDRLRRIRCR